MMLGMMARAARRARPAARAACARALSDLGGGEPITTRLANVARRHDELQAEIAATTDFSSAKYVRLAQEAARLADAAQLHEQLAASADEASQLEQLLADESDAEMRQLAREELDALERARAALAGSASNVLEELDRSASASENAVSGAVVEVRAGAGGDEAALFARELFSMYTLYAQRRDWSVEVLGRSEAPTGGFKEAAALLRGPGALPMLRYEAGVHRVQRVPATEKMGRIHTSTASVAVLPEAEEADVELRDADLRIETCRASGAGGQHVNTTDSAVRVVHIPTGTVAQCQDERSQTMNRAKAIKMLRSRLLAAEEERLAAERTADRRGQIGGSGRSERIRTYNFPEDRITDHRCGLTTHGIDRMLRGELLDEVIGEVRDALAAESSESCDADSETAIRGARASA